MAVFSNQSNIFMTRFFLIILTLFVPVTVFAQTQIPPRLITLMGNIYNVILNPIIALLFGLSFAYFIWGVVKFVWYGEEESMRSEGKRSIVWGIIGMFIMFSVFGILRLIIGTIGENPSVLSGV